MCSKIIIENDDYVVELQYEEGMLLLHCNVINFSKSVYKRMIRDWLNMDEALAKEGFDKVYACPINSKGFIERTGWEYITTFNHDGKEREVYVWELQL